MLHAHGIRSPVFPFLLLLTIDALGDLQGFDIHRRNAHSLVDRHRPPDAHREALVVLEGKDLAESPDIQPLGTGSFRIGRPVFDLLQLGRRPLAETSVAVAAAILRLDEDGIAQILHPVPELPLDADVRDLTVAVVVRAGTVAVERVAIAVGPSHRNQGDEVDLVFQGTHCLFSSFFSSRDV